MNNPQDTSKVIFTDTYKTKELIWEAYSGYIQHYHNYAMYQIFKRSDVVTVSGLNRFAYYMYFEIQDFFDDFKKELGEKDRERVDNIFKKKQFVMEDYQFLRLFFAKFMKVTGIKNIIRERGNKGDSILDNR